MPEPPLATPAVGDPIASRLSHSPLAGSKRKLKDQEVGAEELFLLGVVQLPEGAFAISCCLLARIVPATPAALVPVKIQYSWRDLQPARAPRNSGCLSSSAASMAVAGSSSRCRSSTLGTGRRGMYRECDICFRPACEKHSTEIDGQIICDRCRREREAEQPPLIDLGLDRVNQPE